MKKLLFAVSALAALSLLAPSTGLAQATNILSLYADEAGTMNSLEMDPFTQADIYLVITNPYNTFEDTPINFLGGVEFALTATDALILSDSWPVDIIDVGNPPNYIVGFGGPLTVGDGMATVCTFNFLYQSATGDPAYFQLAPPTPASVPGFMGCLDWSFPGPVHPLTPPYESFDYNVFAVNDMVDTESTTIDAVKALYR